MLLQAAAGVDDAGGDEAGQQVDHARAADAQRLAAADGAQVAGLAVGVDGDALDGPLDGLHAAGDLIALEGRAGGAARHHHPPVADQGDLGVGADVDGHRRRRRRARRVAATTARQSEPTKPAIGGGKCTPPSGFMAKPSSAARSVTGAASAGAKGAPPRPDRRDAEGQVVHGRVAHHRHVVEVARRDRLARAQPAQQLVHAVAGRPAQLVAGVRRGWPARCG